MKKLVLAVVLVSSGVCCFEANSSRSALNFGHGTAVNLGAEKNRIRNEMNNSEIIRAVVQEVRQKYRDNYAANENNEMVGYIQKHVISKKNSEREINSGEGPRGAKRWMWFGEGREKCGIIGSIITYLCCDGTSYDQLSEEIGKILGINDWWRLDAGEYEMERDVSPAEAKAKYKLAVFFLDELFHDIFGIGADSFLTNNTHELMGEGELINVLQDSGFFNN
jgi:hypothetical protein